MSEVKSDFDYINPNIELDLTTWFEIMTLIKKGERILVADKLASKLDMIDKIPDFTLVAMPLRKKQNVQFIDKNTLVAIRDIDPGEKFIAYYPKWMKKLISAPNMLVYYLLQFVTVLLLIIISWVIISLFL